MIRIALAQAILGRGPVITMRDEHGHFRKCPDLHEAGRLILVETGIIVATAFMLVGLLPACPYAH
jgi:hypothetical protein